MVSIIPGCMNDIFSSNIRRVHRGGSPLPMNPPRSFKFRFKINGMRAHCVRARLVSRSITAVFHRMRMRRSFNVQGSESDRCRARKTVYM